MPRAGLASVVVLGALGAFSAWTDVAVQNTFCPTVVTLSGAPASVPAAVGRPAPGGLSEARLEASSSSTVAGMGSPARAGTDACAPQDFPNLDLHDADGFAGVDTITMSFVVSGRDDSGEMKHFARQIVLQGEELQMPEQEAAPPRRRGVRR